MAAALLARAVLRHRPSALALPRARPVLFSSDDSGRRALDALWATPGLLKFQFSRSSGPGGQHVNKVNTRAELRLNVPRAVGSAALPADVAERLSGATTVEGVLAVSAQSLRTQKGNRDACETKLAAMLGAAWEPPAERKTRVGIGSATKARRRESKRRRSSVKSSRGRVTDY